MTRYDQCDETCTVDCGHCKGAGRPVVSPVQGEAVETEQRSYPSGSIGAMFPEAARLMEGLLAERNALELKLAAALAEAHRPPAGSPVHEGEDERRCGYTVTDRDFIEQPCNRPATGWRWYQDCDHEDTLDVACDFHANAGGQRIHDLEARLRDALAEIEAARKDARVYQELYEQRVDTLVQVEAERDALAVRLAAAERKVRAVELLHVWTNDDGKRFVFADELAVALEIPGAEAVTDHG